MKFLALLAAASVASAGAVLDTRFTLGGKTMWCTGPEADDGNCDKIYGAESVCCGEGLSHASGNFQHHRSIVAPANKIGRGCADNANFIGRLYCVKK